MAENEVRDMEKEIEELENEEETSTLGSNSQIIKELIAPHVEEIRKICSLKKIPFFFVIAEGDSIEKGKNITKYLTEQLTPIVAGVDLLDDRITPLLNVMNGFDTIPPRYVNTYDF